MEILWTASSWGRIIATNHKFSIWTNDWTCQYAPNRQENYSPCHCTSQAFQWCYFWPLWKSLWQDQILQLSVIHSHKYFWHVRMCKSQCASYIRWLTVLQLVAVFNMSQCLCGNCRLTVQISPQTTADHGPLSAVTGFLVKFSSTRQLVQNQSQTSETAEYIYNLQPSTCPTHWISSQTGIPPQTQAQCYT